MIKSNPFRSVPVQLIATVDIQLPFDTENSKVALQVGVPEIEVRVFGREFSVQKEHFCGYRRYPVPVNTVQGIEQALHVSSATKRLTSSFLGNNRVTFE